MDLLDSMWSERLIAQLDHMIKMAATPTYGKKKRTFKDLFIQRANGPGTWNAALKNGPNKV